jgi:hypothetical protein
MTLEIKDADLALPLVAINTQGREAPINGLEDTMRLLIVNANHPLFQDSDALPGRLSAGSLLATLSPVRAGSSTA